MSAYFIVDVNVQDAAGFEEYRKRVPATVEKYGGKFLVRGGKFEKLEGVWQPTRVVLLEFPSLEQARFAFGWKHAGNCSQLDAGMNSMHSSAKEPEILCEQPRLAQRLVRR